MKLVVDRLHLRQLDSVRGDCLSEQARVEFPAGVGEADVVHGLDLGFA